jgi:hypothetical protein
MVIPHLKQDTARVFLTLLRRPLIFFTRTWSGAMDMVSKHGVKEADLVRFAVAAYNAGAYSAYQGYINGNVDKYTTHGDYSAWVFEAKSRIYQWIKAHPNWQYNPA